VALVSAAACGLGGSASPSLGQPIGPASKEVRDAEARRRKQGAQVVGVQLAAAPMTVGLAGVVGDDLGLREVPGPEVRVKAGDVIQAQLRNLLPTATTIHWHGIALRNDMDGATNLTQEPVASNQEFTYEFTAPDPGTYLFHRHVGLQLDRGLYAPLIVEDPNEASAPDREFVLMLDDWTDGVAESPDAILARLRQGRSMSGMGSSPSPSMGSSMLGMGGARPSASAAAGVGSGASMGGAKSALLGGFSHAFRAGSLVYPLSATNACPADAPRRGCRSRSPAAPPPP
jgi:multicopper oxidase